MRALIDLTEFLTSPHRTGIQRVCGELCRAWPARVEVTPVKITRAFGMVALPQETMDVMRSYFEAGDGRDRIADQIRLLSEAAESSPQAISLGADDRLLVPEVFFNPGRMLFYEHLEDSARRQTFFIVFDILPLTHPFFFTPEAPHEVISRYFRLTRLFENVGFISEATRRVHNERYCRRAGVGIVLRLGSNSLIEHRPEPRICDSWTFSTVGTIEPRKRHDVIMDALVPLLCREANLCLTIAGRMGWVGPTFENRVRSLPDQLQNFIWREHCDDETIRKTLESSRATIFVSDAEGFGLPPVESLWQGVPVIASAAVPSLESYGDLGIHRIDAVTPENVRRAVLAFLDDDYYRRKLEETRKLDLPTWSSFANQVADWMTQ